MNPLPADREYLSEFRMGDVIKVTFIDPANAPMYGRFVGINADASVIVFYNSNTSSGDLDPWYVMTGQIKVEFV